MSIENIPVQYLSGVGEKRAKILSKNLGINSVKDLLYYFPYEWTRIKKISELISGGKQTISGTVESTSCGGISRNMVFFQAIVCDATGKTKAVWFKRYNRNYDVLSSLKKNILPGVSLVLTGTVRSRELWLSEMNVQDFEILSFGKNAISCDDIIQFYPLTEGFKNGFFRKLLRQILSEYLDRVKETIPNNYMEKYGLVSLRAALKNIHFPGSMEEKDKAIRRLAFEEYFATEMRLEWIRHHRKRQKKEFRYNLTKKLLARFKENLPFEFTIAQKRVINEIFSDLLSEFPMTRLLQGDVGSGKTVVALSSALLAVESGYQAALLAPTEILAEQHYFTFKNLLQDLVNIELIIGKMKKTKKSDMKDRISRGASSIVIGTHAMLEEDINFKNLALIIIDEQHKFGVEQRMKIKKKSYFAASDLLMMTATPIPRTLGLTLYGDLDISTLDKLPPGRKSVKTIGMSERNAYAYARDRMNLGEQVFVVFPLVDESEKIVLKSVMQEVEKLKRNDFKDYSVGFIHGKMKPEEKEKAMSDFLNKKYGVLVSTTVIEVGIDIPNATVMIIQHAERYGLSTLHQLRGRIGRGGKESVCIFIGNPSTDAARKRLKVFEATNDGFRIAEEDLSIRGPGEFFGTAQSGISPFKIGNIVNDFVLIKSAKQMAEEIFISDMPLFEDLLKTYKTGFPSIDLVEV